MTDPPYGVSYVGKTEDALTIENDKLEDAELHEFLVQAFSANIDTNPRAEQTCITLDTGLADFYKEWFDNLPNFDETPAGWEPWHR